MMDLFNSRLLVLYICVCVCVCVQAFGFGLLVVEQHVYSARIRIQDEQTIGRVEYLAYRWRHGAISTNQHSVIRPY